VELEKLLEDLDVSQRDISRRAPHLYRRLGKDTPLRYRSGAVEDEGTPYDDGFSLMDQMVTKEDKKSLRYISAVQKIEKILAEDEERWHRNVVTRSLIERTLTNAAMTMEARTSNAYRESGIIPGSSTEVPPMVSRHLKGAPLPKIHEFVTGIELQYSSTRDILPDDYEHLAQFLMRNRDASRWFAPHEARDDSGRLLPMSQKMVNLCQKNMALKEAKMAAILKDTKEALAWKWLIISHNHVARTKEDRVYLPVKLNLAYSRKARREPRAPGPSADSVKKLLEETVADLRKSIVESKGTPVPTVETIPASEVVSFLKVMDSAIRAQLSIGCSWDEQAARLVPREGKECYLPSAQRWNKVYAAADDLMSHRRVEEPLPEDFPVLDIDRRADEFLSSLSSPAPAGGLPVPEAGSVGAPPVGFDGGDSTYADHAEAQAAKDAPVDDEVLSNPEGWEDRHPEFIEVNGQTFFRNDIQILDVMEGQELRTVFHNNIQYYCVVGEPTGPAKSSKAKGKTATRALPDPPKPKKVGKGKAGKSPDEKPGSSKEAPVAQENPLRVKGEPKSKALSNEQRAALRKFFKLKDTPVPPEVWSQLDSKGKSKAMAERSIPRWASDAVLKSATNLQQIVEGKLTKDNAMTAARDPRKLPAKGATSQALEAWQSLKADFKGTSLFKNPRTAKEKAFKKRFDQLLTDYGQQPCFPKLRERPDQQGRSPSRGRTPASTGLGDMIEMAKAFGQIAAALRGDRSG